MLSKRPGNKRRVFYALGGPGDIVRAHERWRQRVPDTREVSVTFSSQVADFCSANASAAYFVSPRSERARVVEGDFVLEHRPKLMPNATGLRFHLRELWYGCGLLATAIRFRSDVVLLDTGSTTFPVMLLFKLCRFRVVPILHAALWAAGHRPRGIKAGAFDFLNRIFFRYGADAVVGVSPECLRQVEELTFGHGPPAFEALAQFWPELFAQVEPAPPHDEPFTSLFIGRIKRYKGVFDIVEAAAQLEEELPGRFRFEIWGEGPDSDELRREIAHRGLTHVVKAPGFLPRSEVPAARARSHVGIVPTRTEFNEGMAMTAIESVLSGRPLVASSVVPAAEVLESATMKCRANSVEDLVRALRELATDSDLYRQKVEACAQLREPFFERDRGLEAALERALSEDDLNGGRPHWRLPSLLSKSGL
jgi:glycogen(starch) synthase